MPTLKEYFKNDHFAELIGAELLEIRPGYGKARLLVSQKHLNGVGTCQGGAIFTVADLAFAAAVNSHLTVTVYISATITYVRAAHEGYIYAEAVEKVDHYKLPYAEVTVTDEEGAVLAIFTATGYRKKQQLDAEI